MTTHGFELGSLDLASGITHDDGYTLSVLGDGASFGASQAVVREIVSKLADGNLVSYDRAGNRQAEFDVLIEGADGVALQAGEVALRQELYRANTVTWTPPSDFSAPTVFEIVTSEMAPLFDDIDELRDRRKFRVTLTCAPFARSADAVTVEALPSTPTPSTVLVDNCESATGWSASPGDALTVEAITGEIGVQAGDASADGIVSLTRAAAIDMTSHQYLALDWSLYPGSTVTLYDGVTVVPELSRTLTSGGWYRSYFGPVASSAFAGGFRLVHTAKRVTAADESIAVWKVEKTSDLPGSTGRQVSRTIATGGTERTPASIHVQSADGAAALTQVIVHTRPEDGSGYSPPLRRWRTVASTGSVTVDATAFSGGYEEIAFAGSGGFVAEVPTSALPAGGYGLAVRIRAATLAVAGNLFWSTSTIFPDDTTQQGYVDGYVPIDLDDTTWHLIDLDILSLPSVRTQSGKVQITLRVEGDGEQVYLDEAWLFREDDDCALTIVETARPHLWLNSPDGDNPVPTVWVGDGFDTRVHPGEGLKAMGTHVLHPDGTSIFTAALTNTPATDATYYRRWHSNAAE